MTGAMFRFIRRTIAIRTSGAKTPMVLVNATQGPKNIPATDAESNMLMTSQILRVTLALCPGRDFLSKRFRRRISKPATGVGPPAIF
jgi:hypothetical protein